MARDCGVDDRLLMKLRAESEHFPLHATVAVERPTGKCAGPCFLLFAAAGERLTDASSLLGLYRPLPADPGTDAEVRMFFESSHVPENLIEQWFGRTPEHVYWMTDDDAVALKSKSGEFLRYLRDKCAWDESLEREAVAGRRSFADLQSLWSCRRRVIAADARAVLGAAHDR